MPLLLLQSDPAGWTVLPGKTDIGINALGQLCLKQPDGSVTVIASSTPSVEQLSNSSGNTTISPTQPFHSAIVTVNAAAPRTVPLIVSTLSPITGGVVEINLVLPAIIGVIIDLRNGSASGVQLDTFVTDGNVLSGFWQLKYFSGQWNVTQSKFPAT